MLHAQEVSGEVLAVDVGSGLLTLKQPGSTPFHSNLRVLRTEHVTVREGSFVAGN